MAASGVPGSGVAASGEAGAAVGSPTTFVPSSALSVGSSVAVAVGSGVGETVLYATGSSARQTTVTDKRPCDAVIMAIVDTWEVDGEVRYQKDGES